MARTPKQIAAEPEYGTPDEESPEWTEEMFKSAIPFPELAKRMGWKITGRPRAEVTKQPVSLRLDPEIVAHFKAGGAGWQTRINEVLGKHVKASRSRSARKAPDGRTGKSAPASTQRKA